MKNRNIENRLFKKEDVMDFKIIIESEPEIKPSIEEKSLTFDYNKFFLDLLDNYELSLIALNNDKEEFIKYISDQLEYQYPEYLGDYKEIFTNGKCDKNICVKYYGLLAVAAIAAIQFTVLAVDTTVPYQEDKISDNIFLEGTCILAKKLGNDKFAKDVYNYMKSEINEQLVLQF